MIPDTRQGFPDSEPEAVVAALRSAGCVFAEDEARLILEQAADVVELRELVARRVAGLPLEQVLGWAEFCGLRILLDPGVFVPRVRTGFVVQLAAGLARPAATVVDLCCGTGAIGAALLARVPGLDLVAADVDPAAVSCARRNLGPLGLPVLEGDLFTPLPDRLRRSVDLLLVNAPYVPTEEIALMPREARDHEPPVALDGGDDGVGIHRRVAAEAPRWLKSGGHVLIETSRRQAKLTEEALLRNGFDARVERDDDLDATVVVGRLR